MDHQRPGPLPPRKKISRLMAKWWPDPPCDIFCPTRPQWPGGWINDMMGCWSPGSTKCMGVEIYLVGTWHLFCIVTNQKSWPPFLRITCSHPGFLYETHVPTPPNANTSLYKTPPQKKKQQDSHSQLRRWEHELRRGMCDVNGTCKLQARFSKDICGRKEWRINS